MGKPHDVSRLGVIRELIAKGLSAVEIAEQIGSTRKSITSFAARHKLGPWLSRPGPRSPWALPIPDDFREKYPEMSSSELGRHYGRSPATIDKWAVQLGIPKKERAPTRVPSGYRAVPRTHKAWRPTLTGRQPVDRAHRDETQAGQAADYLRRFGPVIRCNAQGHYRQDGDHWLRGSTLLTADEVIDRAQRNGWKAWREAA